MQWSYISDETGDSADYDTCLKFVIKSKLEADGAMEVRIMIIINNILLSLKEWNLF